MHTGSDLVWYSWTETSASTTATTLTAWTNWNTGTTATTADVWRLWTANATTASQYAYRPRELTAEEQAARDQRRAEAQAAEERRKQERAEAAAKAEKILRDNLNAEQLAELERDDHFTVYSRDGQRRYRVRRGISGNVDLLDADGQRLRSFCIHPSDWEVPVGDVMLAQKLFIEHNEDDFTRIANITDYARRAA